MHHNILSGLQLDIKPTPIIEMTTTTTVAATTTVRKRRVPHYPTLAIMAWALCTFNERFRKKHQMN